MPGIAPSPEPMPAQRNTRNQLRNTSRTPVSWSRMVILRRVASRAMELRWMIMSAISGRANRPSVTGTM